MSEISEVSQPIESGASESSEAAQQNPALEQAKQKAPTAQQAAKSNKKAFELKVNNEVKKFEVDFDNEEELKKHFQKALAFDSKAQESAQLRKQMDEIADYLATAKGDKSKLRSLIRELGADEKELAQMIMEEEMEKARKSPEQLEREKLMAELEEARTEKERMKKEAEEIKRSQELAAEEAKISSEINEALSANEIPSNPYFISRLADYAFLASEKGMDIPMKDLAPLVMKEFKETIKNILDVSKDDVIEELLSKERISSIRKKQLAAVRQTQQAVPAKVSGEDAGKASSSAKKEDKKISIKNFLYG